MEPGEEMKKGLAGKAVSEVRFPVCKVEAEIRERCRKDIRKSEGEESLCHMEEIVSNSFG